MSSLNLKIRMGRGTLDAVTGEYTINKPKNTQQLYRPSRPKTREEVQAIRSKYKIGTVIRLINIEDIYAKKYFHVGEIGRVRGVDDTGKILMSWQNGSTLALIEDLDEFEIIENKD